MGICGLERKHRAERLRYLRKRYGSDKEIKTPILTNYLVRKAIWREDSFLPEPPTRWAPPYRS